MDVAFNPISGNSRSGQFDSGHLTAITRQRAQTVTPNLLRELSPFIDLNEEIDEEELLRLLTLDEVELSEEARDILRKLQKRKKKRGRERHNQEQTEEEFLNLLSMLDEQAATPTSELPQVNITPTLPPALTYSSFNHLQDASQQGLFTPHTINPRPKPQTPKPKRVNDDENDISSLTRAGKLGLAMVAAAPGKAQALKVARDLEAFGSDIVNEVKKFGTRFVVVEKDIAFTDLKIAGMYLFGAGEKTPDGRPWSVVRGVYSAQRRVICIGEELLNESERSGRSTVRHEFAHAYEHTWSERRHRRQPLSVELWYRFADSRKSFISAYASTQPAEYFAESVEAFFAPNLSSTLRQADPEMYSYLRELFGIRTY